MQLILSIALNAAFLISVVALVALGLGIIYGLLGVINMAQGEFIALGAYAAYLATSIGAPYWVALIVAAIVGMAAGIVLQWGLIGRLTRRPLDAILVTLGLSLVLQQVFQAIFGASPLTVANPTPGAVSVDGETFPVFRIVVIGIGIVIIGGVIVFLARSEFGVVVRAILQNLDAASANGVNAARYTLWAFGLGAAIAAIAGALLAPSTGVTPFMGATYLAPAFVAVIVGGAGRPVGALVGAAFMGGLQVALTAFIGPTIASATVLILAIVVIRLRPNGLVREKGDRFA